MIKKLLAAALLFPCLAASAKELSISNYRQKELATAKGNYALHPISPFLARQFSAPKPAPTGLLYTTFCSNLAIGVAKTDLKIGGITSTASGADYHVQIGLAVHYGVMSDKRITAFSVELGYHYFTANSTYQDTALGNSHDRNFRLGYLGLPLTYTGILRADRKVGFYYQLGLSPQFLVNSKIDGDKFSGFKRFTAIPSASIGLAIAQEKASSGITIMRLVGPYVSTSLGNLASQDNMDFKTLCIGIRYFSMVVN